MSAPPTDHWLVRPRTIRLLWVVFAAILVGLVLADLIVHRHPAFTVDGTFAFDAWYGFASCVVLVVVAKALGAVFKRPDSYYDG